MDESVDHYLSTSPWPDTNSVETSSWGYAQLNETRQHLGNSFGEFGNNEQAFHKETTSNLTMNCMLPLDALGGNIGYVIGSDLFSGGAQLQKGIDNFNDNALKGLHNGWIKDEHDESLPRFDSHSYEALQGSKLNASEDPSSCDGTSLSSIKIGSVGCNSIENFDVAFGEILPPVYDGYSLPDIVEGNRMQAFGGGRCDMDNQVGSRFVNINKVLQLSDFSASITAKDGQILQSEDLPSLATEFRKAEKTTATGLPQAVLETTYVPSGGCNVSGKPRVRARRGQATDPHSIAERLRREKISERMKSLQELVPNSCKSDKASMLDEIIEYVRFLQLQVKVLSMSRLGAAQAVVPLITEVSQKAPVQLPSSLDGLEYSLSADQIALEKEIVKLMETNVDKAVQYLQQKGLCLMPVALASAISGAKAHKRDNSDRPVQSKSSSSSSNSSFS